MYRTTNNRRHKNNRMYKIKTWKINFKKILRRIGKNCKCKKNKWGFWA